MLIIRSLSGSDAELDNLSDSDDTQVMLRALQEHTPVRDVGHAGTAMRFLTAYFAATGDKVLLTGSDRMKERPIGPLVEALRSLGATVGYQGKEGFPPLTFEGGTMTGGDVEMNGGISSQFISALMMVAPVLEGGVRITLTGKVVSATYIEMTLALMNRHGAGASFDGRHIIVPQQPYNMKRFRVESDWSGASYWYQIAALMPESVIRLPHLEEISLQGDSILATLFAPLGVESRFGGDDVILHRVDKELPGSWESDFTGCPDLAQTLAVTLCALGIPFKLTGTETLRIKETDRIAALESELRKVGFVLKSEVGGEWISWEGTRCEPVPDPVIETYHDHRMAMAFAPLAIPFGHITIEDPMVVTKSYPDFWEDLKKAGFGVNYADPAYPGKTG